MGRLLLQIQTLQNCCRCTIVKYQIRNTDDQELQADVHSTVHFLEKATAVPSWFFLVCITKNAVRGLSSITFSTFYTIYSAQKRGMRCNMGTEAQKAVD